MFLILSVDETQILLSHDRESDLENIEDKHTRISKDRAHNEVKLTESNLDRISCVEISKFATQLLFIRVRYRERTCFNWEENCSLGLFHNSKTPKNRNP